MTHPFKYLASLLALGLLVFPLHAQDEAAPASPTTEDTAAPDSKDKKKEKKEKKAGKARTAVGQALEGLEYETDARPNPKAKFFAFLFSASWCKYCPPVMEMMMQEYPKMKKKQVELILVSPDSAANIAQYVKKYDAKCPVIMSTGAAPKLSSVPGEPRAESLPGIMIVNGKGDVLFNGHGSVGKNWESIIKQKPDKKKAKKGKKSKNRDL
jgi:peroxiredoxin